MCDWDAPESTPATRAMSRFMNILVNFYCEIHGFKPYGDRRMPIRDWAILKPIAENFASDLRTIEESRQPSREEAP